MMDSTHENHQIDEGGGKRTELLSEIIKGVGNTNVKKIKLKYNEAFIVTNVCGDLLMSEQETGLYWQATRYLRTCDLFLEGKPPMYLSHDISEEGNFCQIDLTNSRLYLEGSVLEPSTLHVQRSMELQDRLLIQSIEVTSYHLTPVTVELYLKMMVDFYDIFEVRGWPRDKRGDLHTPKWSKHAVTFGYHGLDEVERETHLTFTPPATRISNDGAFWDLRMSKGQPVKIQVVISMNETSKQTSTYSFRTSATRQSLAHQLLRDHLSPEIHSDNVGFDRLLSYGIDDLLMMCAMTPQGIYPYGGIPSYVCPFGRDGLITCLEFLPWFPELARGTLAFLSAHQGKNVDLYTEEEPGKILHEFRFGELVNLNEVPFAPYYGSIDATPLFLITFESYIRWSNDLPFLEHLWPNICAAAHWMRDYGDADKDSFLEYCSTSEKGLINQGWKDSTSDTVMHQNGRIANPPIALCEVQGYAYAAYYAISYLARRLNQVNEAEHWQKVAEELRSEFLRRFWWEDEHAFYLALDGSKQPCAVVTSNSGQCLWSGIVPDTLADKVINRLLLEDMYSGWGIRTLSEHAARFNPLSYHNGSVWPHDTALIGAGFARYGKKKEAGILLENLFQASQFYERARLPELFCGFARSHKQGPIPYPFACEPQSWAAGAPFMLLSAMLGFDPNAENQRITLHHPTLPHWLQSLELHGLRLGEQRIGLHIERSGSDTIVRLMQETNVDLDIRN